MRTLHLAGPPYQRGATVLQQQLVARGLLPVAAIDDKYGPDTARAVERLKFLGGWPLAQIHHGHEVAGDTVMRYLAGKPMPAAYVERAKLRGAHLPPADHDAAARARVVACYEELIANAAILDYAETRPIPLYLGPIRHGLTDCSGSVTMACFRAHVPDPNGLGYNGTGYTGSLLQHLEHIPRAQVKPADLVVWTPPATGQHVAMFLDPRTGLLGSFGSDPGPRTIAFTDENGYQASHGHGSPVYLRLRTT